MNTKRITGTVRAWFDMRGFGFLTNPEQGGKDIFIHQKNVPTRQSIGNHLRVGELVEFQIIETERGLKAIAVEFPMRGDQSRALPQHQTSTRKTSL